MADELGFNDVLAGPMVRRVESTLVSVWVALRKPASITLQIWEGYDAATDQSRGVPLHQSGATQTLPVGANLHLALLVLTLPEGDWLKAGHIYAYDLLMRAAGEGAPQQGLKQLGLLEDNPHDAKHEHLALGYDKYALPTFAVVPNDVKDLRLLHGSCRNIQGDGRDAMPAIDDLLRDHRTNPEKRAQLLLLTGDQIYADEPAEELLPMLTDAASELLHGAPALPQVGHVPNEYLTVTLKDEQGRAIDVDLPVDQRVFPAGRRQRLVVRAGKLSSGHASSHVMGFGEFAALYLFSWSNVLWPSFEIQNIPSDDRAELGLQGRDPDITKLTKFDELRMLRWSRVQKYQAEVLKAVVEMRKVRAAAKRQEEYRPPPIVKGQPVPETPKYVELYREQRSDVEERINYAGANQLVPAELRWLDRTIGPSRQTAKEWEPIRQGEEVAKLLAAEQVDFSKVVTYPSEEDATADDQAFKGWLSAQGITDAHLTELDSLQTPTFYAGVKRFGFGDMERDTSPASNKDLKLVGDRVLGRLKHLSGTFATLPKVRRALANIATLMSFDDHEVTDDWNVSAAWVDNVNDSPLGRGILRNGLLAFGLFQAWGNDPKAYATPGSNYAKLLELAGKVFVNDAGAPRAKAPSLEHAHALDRLFALRKLAPNAELREADLKTDLDPDTSQRIFWHYHYESTGFRIIGLDSRTFRIFNQGRFRPSGLIAKLALDEMIPERLSGADEKVTFVIAPAPVAGFPVIEFLLQPFENFKGAYSTLNAPKAPFSQAKHDYQKGYNNRDPEPWSFDDEILVALLTRLAPYDQVVFLSGDVHYGFAATLDFWYPQKPQTGRAKTRFVQLTSSAFQNEPEFRAVLHAGFGSHVAGLFGLPQESLIWLPKIPQVQPIKENASRLSPTVLRRLHRNPTVMPKRALPADATLERAPDQAFRMQLVSDDRKDSDRYKDMHGSLALPHMPKLVPPNASEGPFEHKAVTPAFMREAAEHHRWSTRRGMPRVITMSNHLGMVRFEGSASARELIQELLTYDLDHTTPKPFTEYRVGLDIPASELEPTHPATT